MANKGGLLLTVKILFNPLISILALLEMFILRLLHKQYSFTVFNIAWRLAWSFAKTTILSAYTSVETGSSFFA